MKVFIPALGTCLQLNKDWKFILQRESRNSTLFESLMGYNYWDEKQEMAMSWSEFDKTDPVIVTLPIGTVLKVRRIYIRQGSADYNSVTFSVRKSPDKRIEKKMFWAKLYHVNELDCEVVPTI